MRMCNILHCLEKKAIFEIKFKIKKIKTHRFHNSLFK